METSPWQRFGQISAWLAALCFVIGIAAYITWNSGFPVLAGLTPPQAAAARFTYTRQAAGAFAASQLAFLFGMWLYAALGLALRRVWSGGPRADLLALLLAAATLLGSVAQCLDLTGTSDATALTPTLSGDALAAVALTYAPLRAVAEWLLNTMILLYGGGALLAGWLARAQPGLARSWGYLSLLYGVVGVLNYLSYVLGLAAAHQTFTVFMMLSPIWAAGLALALRRPASAVVAIPHPA